MLVSILIPVRNEEMYIQRCLESVIAFELPEGYSIETLILEGISEDATVRILEENFRHTDIKIITNPEKIQSAALNRGIRQSKGEYILRLDAHSRYPVDYLKKLIATSISVEADNYGGVCITMPGGENYGAQVVQAVTTHRFGVGNSGFRVGHKEGYCETVPFGFYRRAVFETVGLFDERLVRSQDYEMNKRIVRSGGKIWQNPEIKIDYFNQRYFSKFITKQFSLEGQYNAYMWFLAPYTLSFRHMITSLFVGIIISGGLLSLVIPGFLFYYLPIFILYFACAFAASVQQAVFYKKYWHLITLPFCFFSFHFSHGLGTLTGLFKLLFRIAPLFPIKEPWRGAGFLRTRIDKAERPFIKNRKM